MAPKNRFFYEINSDGQYSEEGNTTKLADNANVVADCAVTNTGNETVGLGADGDPLTGKVLLRETDDYVTVQERGVATLETVTLLTVGLKDLVVNGAGKVKVGVGGLRCRIRAAWTENAKHYIKADLG